MKNKTSRQRFNSLIKNCTDIELALLSERILTISELTLKDIEENSQKWDKAIVRPHLYVSLCNKINSEFCD